MGLRPPLFPFEAVEPRMGTLIRIKIHAPDETRAKTAFRAAFNRFEALDQTLSDYKPGSELNRICRTAVRQWVNVSDDLFRVLAASQKLAENSEGAFDVTLGPVIRLWREARIRRELPAQAALQEAGRRCGYNKLHLNARRRSVLLETPGMQLDVGGIAKGYAADEALATLNRSGIGVALVAASGDLAFSQAPPGQPGWKIGIDSLDRAGAGFTRILWLSHAAVSTSGDTEQYVEIEGLRYSHIVDPATRMGLTNRVTATVVAPLGIDADGLATAVSVIGAERGLRLIAKYAGAEALIVTPRGTVTSPRFERFSKIK